MRKILSLILISVIVISAIPALSVSAETAPKCDADLFDEASEVLTSIGCADIRVKKDQLISRDAWVNLMLEHSFYEGIDKAELATSGIYSETNYYFHPDENINLGDAVTMLVKLLGFMPGVEYNKSVYINTAQRMDIDRGINASFDDYMTYEMAYVLLFNYLNSNTAELNISSDSVYVKDSGKSILETKYGITTVYALVTDSQSYSLKSDRGLGDGLMSLDGMVCKNERYDSDAYFSRYVTAYIHNYGKTNEIVALFADGQTRVIEISTKDSPSIQNNKIAYYNESNRQTSENISLYAQVFLNGEKIVYDEANILPECGKITIIDNGLYSDGADVVIVESVTDIKIASVNLNASKIYCDGLNNDVLVLDDDIALKTDKGMSIELDSLTSGDILSVWKKADQSIWKAVLCTESTAGTITAVSKGDIFIDGQIYSVSPSRKSFIDDFCNPGEEVRAVFNVYGQIADLTQTENSDSLCGILMQYAFKQNGLTKNCSVKIYDAQGGFSTYGVGEKVSVNGFLCKSYEEFLKHLPLNTDSNTLKQTFVLYELDENDKLISLDYSSDEVMDSDSDSKLYLVGKTEKSDVYTGTYKRYSKYFGPSIFIEPTQTLMFKYPKQGENGEITDDEDLYSVTNLNSVVSGSAYQNCRITGYSIDENSKVANYITVEYESSSGIANAVGGDTRVSMVGEIKKCVWRDETVEAVTVYNSKSPSGTTVYGKDENYFTNLGIECGDIIRVDYSGETMTANATELVWENGNSAFTNGAYTYGKKGDICDVRFSKVYKNWGVVSDVFPGDVKLESASPKDAIPVRTDLYAIFRYNEKLGVVETLTYRDILAYDIAGDDCSKIIYEMRYFDPMSMYIVE